jgi:hypothetical protein
MSDDERLEVVSTSSCESPRKEYVDEEPRDLDICCGRGKGFFSHPGNRVFQDNVRQNVDRYSAASSKNLKSAVVSGIVTDLFDQGIRFIKRDPQEGDRWYVLSVSLAHEKTGHAIRDHLIQRKRAAEVAGKEGTSILQGTVPDKSNATKISHKQSTKKKGGGKSKHQVNKKTNISTINGNGRRKKKVSVLQEKAKQSKLPETVPSFSGPDVVSLASSSNDLQDHCDNLFEDLVEEEFKNSPPVELNIPYSTPSSTAAGLTRVVSEGSTVPTPRQHTLNTFALSSVEQGPHHDARRHHGVQGMDSSTSLESETLGQNLLCDFGNSSSEMDFLEQNKVPSLDSHHEMSHDEIPQDIYYHDNSLGGRDQSLGLSLPLEFAADDNFLGIAHAPVLGSSFVGHRGYRAFNDFNNAADSLSFLPDDW